MHIGTNSANEPDDPPYAPAGTPDVRTLVAWLAEALPAAQVAALAQAAIGAFEEAEPGSALEASLALLSDALHERLDADDSAEETAQERAGCDYRKAECVSDGEMVNGRWVCRNHRRDGFVLRRVGGEVVSYDTENLETWE
jgi:hypothetical protein